MDTLKEIQNQLEYLPEEKRKEVLAYVLFLHFRDKANDAKIDSLLKKLDTDELKHLEKEFADFELDLAAKANG